jgi:hypothetical protein
MYIYLIKDFEYHPSTDLAQFRGTVFGIFGSFPLFSDFQLFSGLSTTDETLVPYILAYKSVRL